MGPDTVELVLAIEEEFGIDIPNEQAARLETVVEQLGVDPEVVTPEANIVLDLGAD